MNKRDTLIALAALAAASLGVLAQSAGKIWRIGYLTLDAEADQNSEAFREQLRALGYIEGRNLSIEFRWAAGREERVPELAAELARLKVDVIVTRTTFVALAAKRATGTIPIVMLSSADPVAGGVIASLARPGGNVTGLSQNATELAGKRLQLLHEIVPKATRFAALVWEKSATKAQFLEEIRAASRKMGIALLVHEVSTTEGLAAAFDAMQKERSQGVIVQTSPFASNNRKQIVERAARHRLPTMFEIRQSVDDGGLMSYGASTTDMHRRAAFYVDKIFKGTKPADLPVEQPTKFALLINLKTAKALGLTIPQTVLLQADEVIK